MDVSSSAPYPAGRLSNFADNPFVLDGISCGGMEGFLQSLKFADPEAQRRVSALTGAAAKDAGAGQNWQASQTLYWRGVALAREGEAYQRLLDRAYDAMAAQNERFREALRATGDAVLTHAVGRTDPRETVLTAAEMCERLHRLRAVLAASSDGARPDQ